MAQMTIEQAIRQASEFLQANRLPEAESLARQVLAHAPANAAALQCLGLIAFRVGRNAESAQLLQRAISAMPQSAELRFNLAAPLQALGKLDEAEAALREAIRLNPGLSEAYLNLGALLFNHVRLDEAASAFKEVTRLWPDRPFGYLNLGKTLRAQDRLDEAEAAFRQAITVAPGFAPAYHMLGSCLREMGRIDESIAAARRAVELDPKYREAHSNLCYALYFSPMAAPQDVLQEHLSWSRKFAEPIGKLGRHDIDRSPDRRLRIGYVSPNLRKHVVGFFMEPILQHHDRRQFEVFCYADVPKPDEVSERLRTNCDQWRITSGMSDEDLARLVQQDNIDILVDLNLHMRGSRLRVFAQKPAPVQITHLAYCGTSGLAGMDWCITDPHMISSGCEKFFTERLLPLGQTYWCYRPQSSPEVGPLPALQNGFITFGSLNTLAKVNDGVIELWAKLLETVPQSRLAVHVPGAQSNPSLISRFTSRGIPMDRFIPTPRYSLEEYLAAYNSIDIALDPFPYCGGTTSLDSLWMGVPLITVAGQMPLARAGVTILRNLGLTELIASDPAEYLQIAASLASDLNRLSELRGSLRSRLKNSPLMDEQGYVRDLENAYRAAWRDWCGRAGADSAMSAP